MTVGHLDLRISKMFPTDSWCDSARFGHDNSGMRVARNEKKTENILQGDTPKINCEKKTNLVHFSWNLQL